jgi:hypothetical protein
MQTQERGTMDRLEARGGQVIDARRDLIHEGNVRKVYVKQDGRVIARVPAHLRCGRRCRSSSAGGHRHDRRAGDGLHH